MAEELSLTALSGEIVAGPRPGSPRHARADDIEDAVFETIQMRAPSAASAPAAIPAGMDLFGVIPRRDMTHAPAAPAGLAFWCAGAALALAAFWFAGGHVLVSRWL